MKFAELATQDAPSAETLDAATTTWAELQPGDVMHLAYHSGPDSTWAILEVTPEGRQARVLVSIDGGEPTEVKPSPRATKAIAVSMTASAITITRAPVTV